MKQVRRLDILLVVAFILLTATVCISQTSREPEKFYEGKTNFTNIGLQGINSTGCPSYIEMTSWNTTGTVLIRYYLWVDEDGDLLIASEGTMEAFTSSFPTGDWRTLKDGVTGIGTVGEQT